MWDPRILNCSRWSSWVLDRFERTTLNSSWLCSCPFPTGWLVYGGGLVLVFFVVFWHWSCFLHFAWSTMILDNSFPQWMPLSNPELGFDFFYLYIHSWFRFLPWVAIMIEDRTIRINVHDPSISSQFLAYIYIYIHIYIYIYMNGFL